MQLNAWASISNRGTGVLLAGVFTGIAVLSMPGLDSRILPTTIENAKEYELLYMPLLAAFGFSTGYHGIKSMLVLFPKAMSPAQVLSFSSFAILGGVGYTGACMYIYSQNS